MRCGFGGAGQLNEGMRRDSICAKEFLNNMSKSSNSIISTLEIRGGRSPVASDNTGKTAFCIFIY